MLTGYKLYIGRAPRTYDRFELVPSPPYPPPIPPPDPSAEVTYTILNLETGTYYFTVTAYNEAGESPQANEVSTSFPACGMVKTLRMPR